MGRAAPSRRCALSPSPSPDEGVEDPTAQRLGHPGPAVADPHRHLAVAFLHRVHADRAAGWSRVVRVLQKVVEHLTEAVPVSHDLRYGRRHLDSDWAVRALAVQPLKGPSDGFVKIDLGGTGPNDTALDARHVEEIGDKAVEPP